MPLQLHRRVRTGASAAKAGMGRAQHASRAVLPNGAWYIPAWGSPPWQQKHALTRDTMLGAEHAVAQYGHPNPLPSRPFPCSWGYVIPWAAASALRAGAAAAC